MCMKGTRAVGGKKHICVEPIQPTKYYLPVSNLRFAAPLHCETAAGDLEG